jgi:SAM-dependent methyltransferase
MSADHLSAGSPPATPLSWRDPDGYVVRQGGRILRAVRVAKAEETRALLGEPWMAALMREGAVPPTVEIAPPASLGAAAADHLWLEHETLDFPCYPHEITALQLFDSASLTLRLAIDAARHGWVIKDASAWNVLFAHGRPVFVDLLSFERKPPTGAWIAYGQFVRHYLLPLLVYRHLGLTPPEVFLTHRDGITPERAHALLPRSARWLPSALELVVLPRLLSGSGGRLIGARTAASARTAPSARTAAKRRAPLNPEIGSAVHLGTLRRLQRLLERLRPDRFHRRSVWAGYEQERAHYSDADLVAKRDFVRRSVLPGGRVLDLGCNAGEFSLLAAENGSDVVAADADHAALARLYGHIRGGTTRITPIMLDIGRPTPAVGWENREISSFLARAAGRFDGLLMLGLIHHLLVSERASLPMIVDLVERLAPKRLVIEWVDPKDPKFRQLAGLNEGLYGDLDAAQLERLLQSQFRLVEKLPLPCETRILYLWER